MAILVVANQKGGVGKTTTAVNLAASIAVADVPTLLVDMDPQANASSGAGVTPRTQETSVYDCLIGQTSFDDAVLPTAIPKLHVLPSVRALSGFEVEMVGHPDAATRLAEVLHSAVRSKGYEHIIIDTPPSLHLLTINALVAAERVLVPLQCEYYPLEGLTDLMDTLDRVRGGPNPKLELDGIVFTMYDPRNNLSKQVSDEVKKHFHVYGATIPRNVRLSEAPSHGKPIVLYDAKSKGCEAYLALGREYLERHGGRPRAGKKSKREEAP